MKTIQDVEAELLMKEERVALWERTHRVPGAQELHRWHEMMISENLPEVRI